MSTVSIEEAQRDLAELIDRVLGGEEVIILRRDAPAAKLVPATRPGYGSLKGQIVMASDFDAPLEDFTEYMP